MSGALAIYIEPRQRFAVANLRAIVERIHAAPQVVRAIRNEAAISGIPEGTLRRMYYAWRAHGVAGLVNRAKLPRDVRRHAWETVYMTYTENDKNTGKGAYRVMMADFRSGKTLTGIGDWRKVWAEERPEQAIPNICPSDWIPDGATYMNLQRAVKKNPDYLFQVASSRRGMKAARSFLKEVLKTRVGLPVGACYQFDDVWHNIDIILPGQTAPCQPLEFVGYDAASGFRSASLLKPRYPRADGTRDNLKEQDFRFLHAHMLTVTGFHKDGLTSIVEHGTTAIREPVERKIKAIPHWGDLVQIARSGILSEQVHAGLFIGNGGGNFKFKALCEVSHNVLHNRTAHLLGNRGRDAEHLHESQASLIKYETRLIEAASKLDDKTRAMIVTGLLTWDDYAAAYHAIAQTLMDDPEHTLEGWDGRLVCEYKPAASATEWSPASELAAMAPDEQMALAAFLANHPECKRTRYMSRREVWVSGQADLVRIPMHEMPQLLDDSDAIECRVTKTGMLAFKNKYHYGRDEVLYHANVTGTDRFRTALIPEQTYRVFFNPMVPDSVWVVDKESGKYLGMAPIYHRAPVYDREAIVAAMGAQASDLARKVLPVRGRHQEEAEERARRMAHNADVIAGAVRPKRDKPKTERATVSDFIKR